ncbi:MAG: Ty1/Copia family ribonuclease HI, partial [Bacteroidota bacterium]
ESHASAVQTILRYLQGTKLKGIVIRPDGTFNLVLWVDADFAGLFGAEKGNNINVARSRMGYVITLGGVPLTWRSQLMPDVCLSTLEAEYSAMSLALRVVIPIRSVVLHLISQFEVDCANGTTVHCTLFEDNQGAYLLATQQKLSPRTKYFAVKMHHFWSHVKHEETNPTGWLSVEKCPSDQQRADMMTKGLSLPPFENNRMNVCGH